VVLTVLLDRDGELAALAAQLADGRDGAGRVIVVEGPAGIGKSSLLAASARAAEADGVCVLRARGRPLERDAAWGVALQLFEPLRSSAQWGSLTVGAAALSRRVLDPDAVEPTGGGDAMHAAARGLSWLAANLAGQTPAILVIDDVHWSDAPSLRWLAQLARNLDGLALGVLVAVRSGEPAGEPELLAELLAAAPGPPVRPRGLGPAAVEALVRERLPGADESFAHACHAVTGGNPFLLTALVGQLVADGIEPSEDVARRLSAFGPDQVARSVELQLSRLPEGATALARAVAVLGSDAQLRHAARLARLEQPQAARLADALRAAGLLDEGDKLTLAHPLVEGALYATLARGQRALWHADAAGLLARDRADAEQIALHLLRTEPSDEPGTVATLREAADRAGARGAPQSAAAFLRRAIAEPPSDRRLEADIRLQLGLALAAYLAPDAPAALHTAVQRADSPGQRAAVALRGARALGLAGHSHDALGLCRQALADPGNASPEALARLEAELVVNAWLNADTREQARERVHEPGAQQSPLELWRVNAAVQSMLDGQPAGEALSLLRPLLDDDALATEPDSLLGTFVTLVLIASDELETAQQRSDRIINTALPRGWLIALAHGSQLRAMAGVRAGEVRAAEADARLAFDYKLPVTPRRIMLWPLHILIDALAELDDLAGADAAFAAAGLGDPPTGALGAPLVLQSRARVRLAQHRPEDALSDLLDAARRWEELGVRHPAFASWRIEASEALARVGDRTTAAQLASEQLALAERVGTPGPRGAALRAVARTAPEGERLGLLEQAVDLLADSPAKLEYARALLDLGAALRRANQRADAREPLRVALDLALRGGMRLLARRASDELRLAGARPRRRVLSGPDALTVAEHRVASLAAGGYNNREIAERLYVTQRTVETHLTHAFQKLSIANRNELAAHITVDEPTEPPVSRVAAPAPKQSSRTRGPDHDSPRSGGPGARTDHGLAARP
jgi:DNA-binding NarL/FixJ family response regulator